MSRLTAPDAYAFWIAGLVLLCVVVAGALRQPPPHLRLPRPTAAQLSTALAWLIIAGLAIAVLLRRPR